MKLIKHILAATDLSGPSLRAVDRGFDLAKTTSARYTSVTGPGMERHPSGPDTRAAESSSSSGITKT